MQSKKGSRLSLITVTAPLGAQYTYSIDGTTFITEGVVPGTGINGRQAYTYTTPAPVTGINFYRLRIFNRNGTVSYTKTLAFDAKGICLNQLLLGNNPVKDELILNYYTVYNQPVQVTVADMTGTLRQAQGEGLNFLILSLSGLVRIAMRKSQIQVLILSLSKDEMRGAA